jgi:hypothetical protein
MCRHISLPEHPARIVATSTLVLGLVACGGDSDSGSSPSSASSADVASVDSAFAAKADDACAQYADYNAHHQLPVKGFSRYAPQEEQLPEVATYLDQNPAYHTLVSDLEDLGQPESGADAWETAVADFSDGQQLVHQEVVAARQSDVDAFVSAEQERADSNAALHADLLATGVPADSSCLLAQTDPLATSTSAH